MGGFQICPLCGQERFPAQAKVYSQSRSQPPHILGVKSKHSLPRDLVISGRFDEREHIACQEIRESQPCSLTIENNGSIGKRIAMVVVIILRSAHANAELMVSANDADFIRKRKNRKPRVSGRSGGSAKGEAARYAELYRVRQVGVHLDANFGKVEVVFHRAEAGHSISRESECIYNIWSDQIGIAQRERLRQSIDAHIVRCEQRWGEFVRNAAMQRRPQITAENGVIGTALIIDPAYELVAVLGASRSPEDSAAWIGCPGKVCVINNCQRRLAEQRGIDSIANEGCSQRDLPACVASGRGDRGEISGQHCRSRNEGCIFCGVLPNDRALIASKEKKLVLNDRSADCAAELIAFQRIAAPREKVSGVEFVVTDEFKKISVQIIRARLGDAANGSCRVHSVLRGECAGFDLELLQRVREGQRHFIIVSGMVVVDAIQIERYAG